LSSLAGVRRAPAAVCQQPTIQVLLPVYDGPAHFYERWTIAPDSGFGETAFGPLDVSRCSLWFQILCKRKFHHALESIAGTFRLSEGKYVVEKRSAKGKELFFFDLQFTLTG